MLLPRMGRPFLFPGRRNPRLFEAARQKRERQKQAQAAGNTGAVSFFKKMRGHALAKTQQGQDIPYVESKPPKKPPKRTPSFAAISAIAGRGPQLKFFQVLIFIIAAICSIIIPPLFGVPPRTFLAIGFVFVGIYNMFPSEHRIMSKIGQLTSFPGYGNTFRLDIPVQPVMPG